MRASRQVAGVVLLLGAVVACGAPPRPEAVDVPATSVVPPQLVPGATPLTRPPLAPAVAVSPMPSPVARLPSPAASSSPSPVAGPVLHPTLPRSDVTPTRVTPAGR